MALAVAQNPHVKDPKLLWKELEKQERELSASQQTKPEMDMVGFEALKDAMRQNPRLIVK